jgi:hypothetical protein
MNNNYSATEICIVLVVALAILGLIFLIAPKGNSSWSIGLNGATEIRCIEGAKFVVGGGGQARQVLGADGKGISCIK